MVPTHVRAPFEEHPLAREGAIAVAAFGAFVIWIHSLGPVASALQSVVRPGAFAATGLGSLAATGLTNSAVVVAGAVAFTAAYARVRGRSVPLSLPDRSDLPLVAAVAVAPVAAVAVVALLAGVTGTSLAALTGSSYAPGVDPVGPATVTGLVLALGLPVYVLVAHALVQRTLRSAARPSVAIGLTTLLIGTIGPTDLVSSGRPLQVAAVTLSLVAAIAIPVFAAEAFDRAWLSAFCAVPLAVFAAAVVIQWATGFDGVAGAALGLAEVGLVAVSAYAYERTDSLLPPALAYAAFVGARDGLSFLVGTGAI
ncbi:hypothetical protein I7X12_01900 [Halosimplex litoreum]|uniref:Uncharacterized protein n=1 Tax=Halosimplex litoreum TaxID=1198301 RepID=A0A7T3KVR4_9EURY|nr:hypothetical protein [Halosimplex litoreum]QPV63414.1 hypothetical protein I7X12_01900 [Halosimplex litoreum]